MVPMGLLLRNQKTDRRENAVIPSGLVVGLRSLYHDSQKLVDKLYDRLVPGRSAGGHLERGKRGVRFFFCFGRNMITTQP